MVYFLLVNPLTVFVFYFLVFVVVVFAHSLIYIRGGLRGRGSVFSRTTPLTQNSIFLGNFGQIWDTFPYTSLQQVIFTTYECV